MSSIRSLALSTVVVVATAASSVGQTNMPVLNVNCGGGSGDLQRAIDNAPAGATVVVKGACSKGPYYLRKNLRLTGDSGEAVLSGGGDRVVDVIGANVRIERLTIDASQNAYGILIEEGSSGILDEVTVRNSQGSGVQAMLASYAGITRSSFTNNLYGIFVDGSSSAWLDDNTLDGNHHAHVAAFANSSAFIYNSRLTDGNIGVLIERMSTGHLAGNVIQGNTGPGVWLSSRISTASLDGNTIQENGPDVRCEVRALLIINAPQTSATQSSGIDSGCAVEGGPLF